MVGGGGRIRPFEGVSRQIYSLLPLAARAPLHRLVPAGPFRATGFPVPSRLASSSSKSGAGGGSRTRDLLLTRQVLCRLSYASLLNPLNLLSFAAAPTTPEFGVAGF